MNPRSKTSRAVRILAAAALSVCLAAAPAFAALSVPTPELVSPSTPSPSSTFQATRDARVFADTALRHTPEGSSSIIRVIPANSFVVLADTPSAGHDWLRVIVDDQVGYVPAKYAEGPWLNQRRLHDTSVQPIPASTQQHIINQNL
jgi:hypothetical protein